MNESLLWMDVTSVYSKDVPLRLNILAENPTERCVAVSFRYWEIFNQAWEIFLALMNNRLCFDINPASFLTGKSIEYNASKLQNP